MTWFLFLRFTASNAYFHNYFFANLGTFHIVYVFRTKRLHVLWVGYLTCCAAERMWTWQSVYRNGRNDDGTAWQSG